MFKKKYFGRWIVGIIILCVILLFLWPRSLLNNIDSEIQSMSVVVVEGYGHDTATYKYNIDDLSFDAIMDILNQYSCHTSLNTISKRLEKKVELEGNLAGYWLNIYLYTEPDCYGECYQITSGGTGEVIIDDGVYHMGYWGNKVALKFMNEICQVVNQ